MTKQTFIKNFPINFFASVMGFACVTMSLKSIEGYFQLPAISSTIFMILTTLLFIVNGGILLMRLIYHHTEVVADFNHPVKMNFFATISIGLLLMGFIYL